MSIEAIATEYLNPHLCLNDNPNFNRFGKTGLLCNLKPSSSGNAVQKLSISIPLSDNTSIHAEGRGECASYI